MFAPREGDREEIELREELRDRFPRGDGGRRWPPVARQAISAGCAPRAGANRRRRRRQPHGGPPAARGEESQRPGGARRGGRGRAGVVGPEAARVACAGTAAAKVRHESGVAMNFPTFKIE